MARSPIHKGIGASMMDQDKVYSLTPRVPAPAEPEIRMLLHAGHELTTEEIQNIRELAALLFPKVHGGRG